ncbi:MAG: hypothetical protein WB998_02825 [Solirubrobacteraceae bacterium]
MPTLHKITPYDLVELIEPVDDIPAGARGGVLELRDHDTALVEITMPALDAVDRVIFAPLAKLRLAG